MLGDHDHDRYSHDSPERPVSFKSLPHDGAGPAVLTDDGSRQEQSRSREDVQFNGMLSSPTRPAPAQRTPPISPARMALEDVLKRQREARGDTAEDIVSDLPLARRWANNSIYNSRRSF